MPTNTGPKLWKCCLVSSLGQTVLRGRGEVSLIREKTSITADDRESETAHLSLCPDFMILWKGSSWGSSLDSLLCGLFQMPKD